MGDNFDNDGDVDKTGGEDNHSNGLLKIGAVLKSF